MPQHLHACKGVAAPLHADLVVVKGIITYLSPDIKRYFRGFIMPKTEAQLKANKVYLQKFDEIKIRLPKGQKEIIQFHAKESNESVNAFIIRAINETILNDKNKPIAP